MTVLLDKRFERTLDTVLKAERGTSTLELWTFDDRRHRREAEARFAKAGISARCRSAYKPLLHFFLEEVERTELVAARIAYPIHKQAAANRFRLEAYPLAGLLEGVDLAFEPRQGDGFVYDVDLRFKDGRRETHAVLAPNRLHGDAQDRPTVSPTGWIIRDGKGPGERLETDYERLFEAICTAATTADWPESEPFFPELAVDVAFPAEDEPLDFQQEAVSLREALHEDLYFTLLDVFHRRSGRAPGDRTLQPGRIVPMVVGRGEKISARVEVRPIRRFATKANDRPSEPIRSAPGFARIAAELKKVGGTPFDVRSVGGRRIVAHHVSGSDVPVMVSGGQHPNEVTGVLGALFGGQALTSKPNAHFTVSPVENPDGYALHQRLCRDNPNHMHHAARYTALGDDLEYRSSDKLWEKEIRAVAQRLTGATLHVNLHGYPSHEWTRPLMGYIPRGFEMWTLPKGFFLILRYHQGWEEPAMTMLDSVTRRLGKVPGLADLNRRQIALYEIHAGDAGFQMINGFPCHCSLDERSSVPVTLITEYPDETIYGDALVAGYKAQAETVVAAYDAWQICAPKA
ncbi:peptidase M14 [Mesorhizobium sp. 8]|uniref:peptidase M14 n=1 Tax=Mesorhizobium sp. 8 TaxID=2584466 RepID=UPI00111FFD52|nr:peptidase M14 [Mesorhizobium sp. 8]QDC02522.1 peptidase M14 [Mesorhizobium sp. 8]